MDFLAKSLGLDINALAVKLAMDDETPVLPAQNLDLRNSQNFVACSTASTPQGPMKADEVRKGVLTKGTGSPVINPIVLRPCQYNSPLPSHASASNVSIVRPEAQTTQKTAAEGPNFTRGETFTNDKIHQAFANLFGSSGNPSIMQTPSFNDNRHQIKAKPLYANGH